MSFVFLKAQLRGGAAGDLFARPTSVAAHVRDGRMVGPYVAVRRQRLHQAVPVAVEPVVDLWSYVPPVKPAATTPAPRLLKRTGTVGEGRKAKKVDTWAVRYFDPAGRDMVTSWTSYRSEALTWMGTIVAGGHSPSSRPGPALDAHGKPIHPGVDSFEDLAVAEPPAQPNPIIAPSRQPDRVKQAAKLRDAGDRIIAAANDSMGRDRQSNTARRARMAASSIHSAQTELRIGETMRNLADAIESGEAESLSAITSRAAVEQLDERIRDARVLRWRKEGQGQGSWDRLHEKPYSDEDIAHASLQLPTLYGHNARDIVEAADVLGASAHDAEILAVLRPMGFDDHLDPTVPQLLQLKELMTFMEPRIRAGRTNYQDYKKRNAANAGWSALTRVKEITAARTRFLRMGLASDADLRVALGDYLRFRSGAKHVEDPVKKLMRGLVGSKPGIDFFPTTPELAQLMVNRAGVGPGMRVLEPSAGSGNIADAIEAAGGQVDAVELSHDLRAILTAKGHTVVGQDFETFEAPVAYDAVIMNPPWSGGADVRHTMRAWDMLKPGGTLVSLISPHATFATDKASRAFREWVEANHVHLEKQAPEGLISPWMRQGIGSFMVVATKP